MIRFKYNGEPYIDEQLLRKAINNWANAKGVDPDHVFSAVKPPLSSIVKGDINTSIFEEAVIIE